MKSKIYLLVIIFFCSMGWASPAILSLSNDQEPIEETTPVPTEPIPLYHSATTDNDNDSGVDAGGQVGPRLLSAPSISASLTKGKSVDVLFYANLGTVSITIEDVSKFICYETNVNTVLKNKASIDIRTLPAGSYTIVFKNTEGRILNYGSFNN